MSAETDSDCSQPTTASTLTVWYYAIIITATSQRTCAQALMHAIALGGCTNTATEFPLNVGSGRKLYEYCNRVSTKRWIWENILLLHPGIEPVSALWLAFGPTLCQLSYPAPDLNRLKVIQAQRMLLQQLVSTLLLLPPLHCYYC